MLLPSPSQRAILAALSVALSACREPPAPAYLRVRGPAPTLPAGVALPPTTLVVFWAAWCEPCREETPSLVKFANAAPAGLSVVVLSADESMAEVDAFFNGKPPAALHLRLDENGAVARAFGVDTLPTSTLVVDGQLVARFAGPRDWDAKPMRRLIERLLAESHSSSGARR